MFAALSTALALGQQPLPPKSVQAELVKENIRALLAKDRVAEALPMLDELRALEPEVPPSYRYHEARAADVPWRSYRAQCVLQEL